MKKLITLVAIAISTHLSAQFRDGNYKLTTDYFDDLNEGSQKVGIKTIILQSSLNKITLISSTASMTFNIISKEVSHDGITTGDMEYRTVGASDHGSYLFIFKQRSPGMYSVNLSSLGGSWWEFHITQISYY